jgi:hypothetical protein
VFSVMYDVISLDELEISAVNNVAMTLWTHIQDVL